MAKPITAAEFTSSVERMMEDPALTRETRAFAIALIHEMRMQGLGGRSRRKSENVFATPNIWRDAAWLLQPGATESEVWRRLKWIIAEDAPRYDIERKSFDARLCVGTMLRPLGAPCKKRVTVSGSIRNPFNGEMTMAGACSNPAHRAAYEAQHKASWAAWRTNGEPQPKNNTGGHLMRHFTYPDWDALYGWASYRFAPGATPEPEPPRARLALVTSIHGTTPARPEGAESEQIR
ncbi:hypothetical protein E3O68_00620 [Cryobacterium sp. TMB3-1-2]|uniref:hypothetical protein n=1 Tax=unclassified Cryobacterium TaxID=2649013 RepID=UPI00106B8524|nr:MULTISPECIES: hypothetical protein [unclassified Cryobacterium]TFC59436.1 hypothetical protein E3O68_00620 [Cryobacterium sp. TMB3-1-2]TFC73255.1 hypothetical protein E3T22_16740 [Cryobacterium sp. TMB3-10]TFD46143.1 hypothetical protein E3T58_01375 [Cryobacterium sp. TMB3-12]